MKSAILSNSSYLALKTNSKILYLSDLLGIVAPTALVDYQFRLQGTLTNYGSVGGSLPLTRAGNGTYIDNTGLLATAGTNVARFDFDPLSLTRRGLLFEGQKVNLMRQSEAFNVTPWGASGLTANAATGPDGNQTVDTVSWASAYFGFFNESASSWFTGGPIAPPFSIGANWGRVSVSFTTPATCTQMRVVVLRDNLAGTNQVQQSAIPVSASTAYTFSAWYRNIGSIPACWGTQIELGSLSSYIQTTTAAATRFTDSASMTGLPSAGVTLIEKPAGCANLSAGTLTLNTGYTIDRIMVLPGTYSADQVATIRGLM
jgi:hypothetical protein